MASQSQACLNRSCVLCGGGEKKSSTVDRHRWPVHDNVSALSPVCCSLDILYVMLKLSQGKKCRHSLLK